MARMTKLQKAILKADNEAKRQLRHAEVALAVKNGCPICGAGIRRNLSMTGWFQCSQLGAEGFRADATKPSCSWQCFAD